VEYPEAFAGSRLVTEREIRTRPEWAVSRLTPWIAGVFSGMVALALLVACANVANLLLVRATARRSEIAIRSAIGATPGRLIRLLLTESIVLGAVSLVVAFFLARFCIGWLNTLPLAVDVPVSFGLAFDWRVFLYAAVISLAAGLISGLAPALMGARSSVSDVLRDGGRSGTAGRGRTRLRSMLVVSQVAVSFLLLVCGGLFIRSARSASHVDLGFARDRLLIAQADLSLHQIDRAMGRQVQDRLLDAIGAVPGVERVALGTFLPMSGNYETHTVNIDDRSLKRARRPAQRGDRERDAGLRVHDRSRLRRDATSPHRRPPPWRWSTRWGRSAVARRDPMGQSFRLKRRGRWYESGLFDNVNVVMLGETPQPMVLLPLRQQPSRRSVILVKSRGPDPSALTAGVRAAVATVNPNILLYGVRSMAAHLDQGIALFFVNIGATLATVIGVLGLFQTIVGLYGVLSYSVAQRAKEFGIRMALGAQSGAMIRVVLRQSAMLVAIGLLVGGVLAVALTRGMRNVLIGVSPTDALTYGAAVVIVGGLAMISSYVPAWRASRVEPAMVVRAD
jgi:predicted permease